MNFMEQYDNYVAQAEAILADESREYNDELQAEVDSLKVRAEGCKVRQAELDKVKANKVTVEERSFQQSPAFIRSKGPGPKSNLDINQHAAREKYSIARAATSVANQRSLSGLEAEVHDELYRSDHCVKNTGHFLAPFGNLEKLNQRTNFTLTTGAGAVPVWTDGINFVDYLYPLLAGPTLGFTYYNNLPPGTHKFPRLNAPVSVAAVAEAGSNSTYPDLSTYVQFSQHTATGTVAISREIAMQSVVAADQIVMQSLAKQIAEKLDLWAFAGGSTNEPVGILNNSAITNQVVATSNIPTWGNILKLERLIEDNNAKPTGYLSAPAGKQTLKNIAKIGSTFPTFICADDDSVNGKPLVTSSNVPASLTFSTVSPMTVLICGDWQYCAVATFGSGLSMIVDPYSLSDAGGIRITALMDTDVNVLHTGAFSYMPNILVS